MRLHHCHRRPWLLREHGSKELRAAYEPLLMMSAASGGGDADALLLLLLLLLLHALFIIIRGWATKKGVRKT